jgi:hypothetical protein
VTVGGEAVTSTRIRRLVADGKIREATELLGGHHPCVSGVVHPGRGEGRKIGFPTANVVPVQYAALPSDGVYAGRAVLDDGSGWAAAISVGVPPTFPEAKDYLEAHLIEFDGDLNNQLVRLEFWERLRDQHRFATVEDLYAAIEQDVERSLEIAGFTDAELAEECAALVEYEEGFGDEVSDPAMLAAAEREAMTAEPSWDASTHDCDDWVCIDTRQFSIFAAGAEAFALTSPLEAAGVPYAWSPYPPADTPQGLRGAMTVDFELLVPAQHADAARAVLEQAELDRPHLELPAENDLEFVDDPAALEAAERAAQAYREQEPSQPSPPDDWIDVLSDMPFDRRRFLDMDAALTAVDIRHVWQPYPPQNAALIRLSFWDTERFSISVPESQAEEAAEIIASVDDGNADRW